MTHDPDPRERMSIDYSGPVPVVVEDLPSGANAAYWLEARGNRVEVRKVTVTHDGRPVSGRDLRSASPALVVEVFEQELSRALTDPEHIAAMQHMEKVLRQLALHFGKRDEYEAEQAEREDRWRGWHRALKAIARKWGTEQHLSRPERLAVVAAAYVVALSDGVSAPNRQVAEAIGMTTGKVTEDLRAARREGLLTEAPGRGMPGGDLTSDALAILQRLA